MKPLMIVGAGLAGWTTAREFRRLDSSTPITLVTADSGDFYAKPSLSNAFAQGKLPAQLVSTPAAKMAETLKVTLLPRTRVTGIHPSARTVDTSAGVMAYSDLVLATGAQPITFPMSGNAAHCVLSVNSLEDFVQLHAQLQPSDIPSDNRRRHVLIMGAGLIGCEFANDMAQAGYRVSVVDPGARVLAALLPDSASAALQVALERLGVRFYLGNTVRSVDFAALDPDGQQPMEVSLAGGERIVASCVLSAIGLRPDVSLAKAAGLLVERGITVDWRLQTSAQHIYALGDGAQYASATSKLSAHGATLPYVMPIMAAARALAANLTGTATQLVFPLMPVSVKTPALPLVVAAPQAGLEGSWALAKTETGDDEADIWHWTDAAGRTRGFVLAGAQTAQRQQQSKQLTP